MNCTALDEVDEFEDLGILTDRQLSWNEHVDSEGQSTDSA